MPVGPISECCHLPKACQWVWHFWRNSGIGGCVSYSGGVLCGTLEQVCNLEKEVTILQCAFGVCWYVCAETRVIVISMHELCSSWNFQTGFL